MRLLDLLEDDEPVRIKLSGFGNGGNPKARNSDDFIDELYAIGTSHPFNDAATLLGPVSVEMESYGPNTVWLNSIITQDESAAGNGTRALQMITNLADKHNVSIDGNAKFIKTRNPDHIKNNKRLVQWYQKNGFAIGDGDLEYGYEISYTPQNVAEDYRFITREELVAIGEDHQEIPADLYPDTGVKIGAKARFWRGESETSGRNGATYGAGLYTTTDRKYAKQFGTVREVSRWEALPDNPARFRTILDWQLWLQRLDQYNGVLGARDRWKKFSHINDMGDYVRTTFPDIDGVQIGTGRDAVFVAWPVS